MRKQFVQCETREQAEAACPWAAEIIEVDNGGEEGKRFVCFESVTDAETFQAQA
jgi:hypothetical protein